MKSNDDDYNELTEYAHADGTEIGNYVIDLLCMRDYSEPHGMTESFSDALNAELWYWLEKFRSDCEIVEKVEPQPDRKYKVLIWK
jgi:hypothetical protein